MDKTLTDVILFVIKHKLEDCVKLFKEEINAIDVELEQNNDSEMLLISRKNKYKECSNTIENVIDELIFDE